MIQLQDDLKFLVATLNKAIDCLEYHKTKQALDLVEAQKETIDYILKRAGRNNE